MERRLVQVTARFLAHPASLPQLHEAFDQFVLESDAAGAPIATSDRIAIVTASAEVCANIIEHACVGLADAWISTLFIRHHDRVEVRFEDPGVRLPATVSTPLGWRSEGGRGLALARASANVEYVRLDGTNRWRLVRMAP